MHREKFKPRISVLTPSWNRADYLARVWQALESQAYGSFEWIVGNDGSADATHEVVQGLAQRSSFPVTLIEASVRIGKSCMDNLLVEAARGEFVVWCDSDDALNPSALHDLLAAWDEIPLGDRNGFMGVSARAETEEGLLGRPIDKEMDGCAWNLIYSALGSDLVIMARTELLKQNPFLEVDFLIPETSVWSIIGENKSRFIDQPLKTVHYGQPFALSYSGKMQYNRGRAYALGRNYRYVRNDIGVRGEFMRAVNFVRYCMHGDIGISKIMQIWSGSFLSNCMLIFAIVPAMLLATRDNFRGVVEKTHIQFERNRKLVQLTRRSWEGNG